MKIDNRDQLEALHLRFAQVDGALGAAAMAQQHGEALVRQYMEMLGVLLGTTIRQGQRVEVNWESGEVTIGEQASTPQNGVAV